jgi:uncharacterized protein (TIGR02246 family)
VAWKFDVAIAGIHVRARRGRIGVEPPPTQFARNDILQKLHMALSSVSSYLPHVPFSAAAEQEASMKHHSSIAVSLAVVLLGMIVPRPLFAAASADEAAIEALVRAFESASNQHDSKAFAAVFALDGEFTSVRGSHANGRRAIEEYHRPFFEGDTSKGNPSFKNAVLKIESTKIRFVRPDVAVADIFWTQTGSATADGRDRGLRKGLMDWVLTREGTDWHVAVMHNAELPIPVAPTAPGKPTPHS